MAKANIKARNSGKNGWKGIPAKQRKHVAFVMQFVGVGSNNKLTPLQAWERIQKGHEETKQKAQSEAKARADEARSDFYRTLKEQAEDSLDKVATVRDMMFGIASGQINEYVDHRDTVGMMHTFLMEHMEHLEKALLAFSVIDKDKTRFLEDNQAAELLRHSKKIEAARAAAA